MNKRIVTVGLLILAIALVTRLLFLALKNIKVDEFKPAAIMFIIDSSASNQGKLDEQKKYIKSLCNTLDPEDTIKILKVSEDSYLIYEGTPHNNSGISKSMEEFTKYNEKERGTAYGQALKKAFNHALTMKKDGYVPAIVVIGDLENEGNAEKQINWNTLPKNVAEVQKYAPDLAMMFVYAHPSKLDLVKEKLSPVLGESKLIVSTEINAEKSARKLIEAIGR